MRKMRTALTWALVLLLGTAGAYKMSDPAGFSEALRGYLLLPTWSWPVLLWLVPIGELLLAAGMAWHRARPVASWLVVMTFAGFAALMTWSIIANALPDGGCGCFPWDAVTPAPLDLARNWVLLVMATIAAWPGCKPGRAPAVAGGIILVAIVGVSALGITADTDRARAEVLPAIECGVLDQYASVFGFYYNPDCDVCVEIELPYLVVYQYRRPGVRQLWMERQLMALHLELVAEIGTTIRSQCGGADATISIWQGGKLLAELLGHRDRQELKQFLAEYLK